MLGALVLAQRDGRPKERLPPAAATAYAGLTEPPLRRTGFPKTRARVAGGRRRPGRAWGARQLAHVDDRSQLRHKI